MGASCAAGGIISRLASNGAFTCRDFCVLRAAAAALSFAFDLLFKPRKSSTRSADPRLVRVVVPPLVLYPTKSFPAGRQITILDIVGVLNLAEMEPTVSTRQRSAFPPRRLDCHRWSTAQHVYPIQAGQLGLDKEAFSLWL